MSNKKNFIWIATISFVLIGVLVALCVGITSAWFVAQRRAEGTLEFVDGIKIEYSNLYLDEQDETNKTLKLAYVDDEVLYALEIDGVEGDEIFNIANPSLKAKEGTVPYYVRVKLNINLYYDNNGEDVLIDNTTRADFLATTEGYTKNDEPVVITNETQLFLNLPELDVSKFVYFDGWYYLSETQGEVDEFEDIALTECSYDGTNTEQIKLLEENLNGEVLLALDNSIDFGEKMPFSKMTIALEIEAVETDAVSTWNN